MLGQMVYIVNTGFQEVYAFFPKKYSFFYFRLTAIYNKCVGVGGIPLSIIMKDLYIFNRGMSNETFT
jgi:hypothetical protein